MAAVVVAASEVDIVVVFAFGDAVLLAVVEEDMQPEAVDILLQEACNLAVVDVAEEGILVQALEHSVDMVFAVVVDNLEEMVAFLLGSV